MGCRRMMGLSNGGVMGWILDGRGLSQYEWGVEMGVERKGSGGRGERVKQRTHVLYIIEDC